MIEARELIRKIRSEEDFGTNQLYTYAILMGTVGTYDLSTTPHTDLIIAIFPFKEDRIEVVINRKTPEPRQRWIIRKTQLLDTRKDTQFRPTSDKDIIMRIKKVISSSEIPSVMLEWGSFKNETFAVLYHIVNMSTQQALEEIQTYVSQDDSLR